MTLISKYFLDRRFPGAVASPVPLRPGRISVVSVCSSAANVCIVNVHMNPSSGSGRSDDAKPTAGFFACQPFVAILLLVGGQLQLGGGIC